MTSLDQIIEEAVSDPVLSDSAEEIGKNLLQAMIESLTLIPHPTIQNQSVWSTRKEAEQDETIDRFQRRIKVEVMRGFHMILAGGNPTARATLEKVVFSDKGIQGTLHIEKHSGQRHSLADFAGREVAIIMPDSLDEYFESMGEISGEADQSELDLKEAAGNGEAESKHLPVYINLVKKLKDNDVEVPIEFLEELTDDDLKSLVAYADALIDAKEDDPDPECPNVLSAQLAAAEQDDAQPADISDSDAELIASLANANITVDSDTLSTWSTDDRVEAAEYAATIAAGKLPKQIPAVIAPLI